VSQDTTTPSEKIVLLVNGLTYRFFIDNSMPDDMGSNQYNNVQVPYEPWCNKMLKAWDEKLAKDTLYPENILPMDQPRYAIICSLDTYFKIRAKFMFWIQEEVRNASF
jgi:hypothetical protein